MRTIAIIGAGNMGGSIARGLYKSSLGQKYQLVISNRTQEKLMALKEELPGIITMTDNQTAIADADIIIFAVKPWLIAEVIAELKIKKEVLIASVAAGISTKTLASLTSKSQPIIRLMPNTAISLFESITLLSTYNTTQNEVDEVLALFNELGMAIIIDEEKMSAATALASCGIAYAMKYIQASMQAGIEMGIPAKMAQLMSAQCVKGAAELLLKKENHPSAEIDRVTTPGGLTIKGINELEHGGFSSALIKAILASNK
ncbi:MAG: pyrroline-5-carboxylate reductase [Bacteroidaceae bacterium]